MSVSSSLKQGGASADYPARKVSPGAASFQTPAQHERMASQGSACPTLPQRSLTHYCMLRRPILLPIYSVNQRLPSEPTVIP